MMLHRLYISSVVGLGVLCASSVNFAQDPAQVGVFKDITIQVLKAAPDEPKPKPLAPAQPTKDAEGRKEPGDAKEKEKPAPAKEKIAEKKEELVEAKAAIQIRAAIPLVPAMAIGGRVANPANLEADEASIVNFTTTFKPVIYAEYRFIGRVCKPTKEEGALIAQEAVRAVFEAAKQCAETQKKMENGRWNWNVDKQPNARDLIEQSLRKSIAKHFAPEKAKAYEAELVARETDRKRVSAMTLVALLDRDLQLSQTQREVILKSVLEKMDNLWTVTQNYFLYGDNFVPQIPSNLVYPALDTKQKAFYSPTANSAGLIWGNFGITNNGQQSADPLDNAPEFVDAWKIVEKEREVRRERESAAAKAKAN